MRRSIVVLGVLLAAGGAVSACGQGGGPLSAEAVGRAQGWGVDPALVYVTKVEGYSPAAGGAGVYGDAGYQGVYTSRTGADLRLTVERRTLTAQTCPEVPIPAAAPGAPVECTADGEAWRRSSGDRHEYALPVGDLTVMASGPSATPVDVLRQAATEAHPASSDEILEVLPPPPGGPVERGDITGDNAPDNHVGPGG
ncbi:hypothetical protein ACIB24_08345 [Spongisporangium articulatum]|uniref:Secreted protein n=1 Tax=Spongisporangium articulatum TaxID=3362603 RepID=A0ABW8AL71_9ACTN